MDISSIINIAADIISPDVNAFSEGDPAAEISFGDILGAAVDANTDVVDVEAQEEVIGDIPADEEEKTFAELVDEFTADISNADSSVIDAAVKMLLSVGNAAERFMYGESNSNGASGASILDEDGEKTDVVSVLSEMITLVTSEAEEDFVSDDETGLALVLGDISAVIEKGITEGEPVEKITEKIKELADSDDPKTAMIAEAVVSMMAGFSGFTDEGEHEAITFEAAAKTASVTEVLSEDLAPTEKAATILSIMENKTDFKDAESFAEFQKSLKAAFYTERQPAESSLTFTGMHKPAAFVRINDVSAQVRGIFEAKADTAAAEQGFAAAAPVLFNTATPDAPDVEIPSDPVQVYRELADFTIRQITETVMSAPRNNSTEELVVVLKPENLGEVAVKLTADASGAVSVVLAASNEEVGRALAANTSALAESFAKQNINVENVDVVNPSQAASYMGLDFSNQGFNRRNGDAPQSERQNGGTAKVGTVSEAGEAEVSSAKKLLKEAKLWLTA